jgi:hypothetical protein
MPSRSHTASFLVGALLLSQSVLAVPFPDEFVGPPSYSLMGCPHDAEWTRETVAQATGLGEHFRRLERHWGLSPQKICVTDPVFVAALVKRLTTPKKGFDEPDQAWEQRAMMLRDENGNVPADGLTTALEQRQRLIQPPGGGGGGYLALAGGLDQNWTSLGPGFTGGRVRAIYTHPTPGKLYVGSVSGGIFMSTNSGGSWNDPFDPYMPNVAIRCLVRDPLVATGETIYACTGEGVLSADAVRGLGIFKTTDGGVHWQQLPSTNPATAGTDWYYVNRLAIQPDKPGRATPPIMLAATNGGLYRSLDSGTSWTKVYEAVGGTPTKWRAVQDVSFHPEDPNLVILGESQHVNCLASPCVVDGAGVAISTNAGQTWSRTRLNTSAISGNTGRVEVAFAKNVTNIAYAVVDMAQGQFYKGTASGGTWTWTPNTPTSVPAHLGTQGWYNNAIWVADNDANRILIGGIGMRFSTNGGSTWTTVGNTVHSDHHIFVSDPAYATNFTAYGGNDGGIYKITGLNTATPTFTSLNNNLPITQFYGGHGNPNTGRILGGSQDNGTLLYTGSPTWARIWGADGGNAAADQSDGNYVYGMDQFGGIMRNTAALGASPSVANSAYICQGITDAACPTASGNTILFIPPMVIDKSTNSTLYVGAKNLWRSTNIKAATVTWSIIKAPTANGSLISAIAIAPSDPNIVWIGYRDSTVACTTNATAATPTWITPPFSVFGRYVTRIAIDPSNANRVVVALGGYNSNNLHLNTMGCVGSASFTNIHGQIPTAPIRAIEFHPNNSQYMYVGTEVGLFTTSNGGGSWTTTNDGPGTVSVEHLFWMGSDLIAVTHGRGMFKHPVTLPGGSSITSAPPPNGTVGVAYSFTFTSNMTPTVTWALSAGTWPPGLTLNAASGVLSGTPTTSGSYPITIGASNTNGNTASQTFTMQVDLGVPGSPTAGSATPGNGTATVTFFAGPSGASAITGYTVTCVAAGQPNRTGTGSASPITVTTMTNGVQYSCTVTATNAQGTSNPSNAVLVTPANAGPTCNVASPPGGSVGSPYSASVSATGSPAPTFAVSSGALPGGLSLNATSGAITGTPNAGGTFTGVVTATNSGGSCPINFSITIGATVPGAPTIGTGTPGTNSATISFTPPASNGGSAITRYTATCGAQSQQGASSPITVTGLASGVSVSCSVKANNAVGSSAASGSVSVTPTGVPAFTSGAAPGGTFNVAYSHTFTASGSPAPTFTLTSGALPGGLSLASNGTLSGTPNASGTFTGIVTATNSAGSATQNFSIAIAATVPGAPVIGSATPGSGQATISFTAPASNGGSAITGYTATCNPGGFTGTGAGSPITVAGLTAGTTYTCSVTATNGAGTSAASGTVSVVPVSGPAFTSAAPPGGTFGSAYAHVYTASGSPVPTFGLTAGAFPPGLTLSGPNLAGTPTATGTFTGTVTATNSGGSTPQNFSITIAPAVPGAPTIGAATPGIGQATIAFTAPASDGGAAITSFTATCNPGALSAPGAASPITVTGLTNGTAYTCSVRANNSAGSGAASGTVGVTPGAAPAFTSAAPAGGTYNVAYSHTYTASGAPAATFAVTSGALPPGLTLASGGALTGTPSAGGTFTGVVTASNSLGNATQAFSITIATTLPGAPTIGAGTPGPGFAMIGFTPPAATGGTPITSYTATCTPGPFGGSNSASPVTVNALTNGTTKTCSVTATNAVGTGPASGTVTVTPAALPAFSSAPPPGGAINVAYSHTYAANGTPAPTFSLTSGAFPTGLALNGTSGLLSGTPTVQGTFTGVVTATNSAGSATQAFSITIGAAVPGAPTIGAATPGNGQASISFTAPASNGGSPITSYTATCNPGGITGSAAASPVTVAGLTNGTAYSCSVKANNAAGASAASGSVSVTPGVAPAFTSAAPAGGTFGVAYTHTYVASGAPAPTFSVTSGALPTGLALNPATGAVSGTPTAGGTFTGVVTASNALGNATQAFSIAIAAVVPGAPTIGTAVGGVGQATVSFTPPASNGGATITSYTASCAPQPNGPTRSASGAGSPITVTNMSNGTPYLCSVRAVNSAGTGPTSGNVGVTPGSGPSITSVAPGGGTFGVAYTHTYTATGSPAPTFGLTSGAFPAGVTLDGTTGVLSGTPAATGTFTGVVTASSSGGSATQAFSITIAATVPGAPTIGTATPGAGQLTITFSPPASNGGSPITGYTASCNPGGITASGASSPITVSGLANGTAYTCSVKANNAIGSSAASATVGGTPTSTPSFTSAAAPNGVLGVAYSHTFAASGSPAPTFSLTTGAFPTGLTLNPTTGQLAGTPTAAGTFTGVVTATNAAGTATQGFSILVASVPGAPTIGSATPGNKLATISFAPPASNGGAPITSYTVTCNPGSFTANGAASPLTVMGLTNGTTYTCSVRAVNAVGTGPASGTVSVTPASGIVLALLGVSSRKVHGSFGSFDLPLNAQPIGGTIVVEPRMGTGGHKIVFTFNDELFSAGTVTSVDALGAPAGAATRVVNGNSVEVTLTGLPDRKRVTVSVSGVNGTMNVTASLGFMVGDVNNSYGVESNDILRIKGKTGGAPVTADTFIYDLDLSGGVSLSDVNAAKANSGLTLP